MDPTPSDDPSIPREEEEDDVRRRLFRSREEGSRLGNDDCESESELELLSGMKMLPGAPPPCCPPGA